MRLGRSSQMCAIGRIIAEVADTDATVLIRGECGVGKDHVARTIHGISARRERPFVKVNCAAIPVELLESELFGHERGAFTGAYRRKLGQFEQADHGTIYLDEIAELPLALQAKLLHVLQDLRFTRVGSCGFVDVDALEGLVDLSRGTPGPVARPSDPESLREVARRGAREAELKALQDVLEGVGWNRAEAARILKVSYKTMLNKVAQYSLTPSRCV